MALSKESFKSHICLVNSNNNSDNRRLISERDDQRNDDRRERDSNRDGAVQLDRREVESERELYLEDRSRQRHRRRLVHRRVRLHHRGSFRSRRPQPLSHGLSFKCIKPGSSCINLPEEQWSSG